MPLIKNPSFIPHPQLSRLVAPLAPRKQRELVRNLARWGCSDPIRIWQNYVLVDLEAYDYCIKHNIAVNVRYIAFQCLEDATAWICKSQFSREDISEAMRRYIIGAHFRAEKQRRIREVSTAKQLTKDQVQPKGAHSVFTVTDNLFETSLTRTAEILASQYHVSAATVRKYATYATMMDQLYSMEPALAAKVMRGEIYIGYDNLLEVTSMNAGDVVRLSKYFLEGPDRRPTYTKFKAMLEKSREKPQQAVPPPGSIKEMPEYDPDAEVSSLALTIPSWIGSIQRAERNSDFFKITERARAKLIYELNNLIFTANNTISALKEKQHG